MAWRFEPLLTLLRPIDAIGRQAYVARVQTTVEIDDAILRQAEQQARRQGKSLAVLMEEALRAAIQAPSNDSEPPPTDVADGLEDNDPFFAALAEIRAHGRLPTPHRAVDLE